MDENKLILLMEQKRDRRLHCLIESGLSFDKDKFLGVRSRYFEIKSKQLEDHINTLIAIRDAHKSECKPWQDDYTFKSIFDDLMVSAISQYNDLSYSCGFEWEAKTKKWITCMG